MQAQPLRILGIDAGYANFAYCLLVGGTPTEYACQRLFKGNGKPSNDQLFWAMRTWCIANERLLGDADQIVLERQMQARFKLMNCVVRTLYPEKTLIVSPNTVTAHFKLTNKREIKKREAVEQWRKRWPLLELPPNKADDVCDAALLALYVTESKKKK